MVGESTNQIVEPLGVVVDGHRAVDVGHDVVPGRHHPAVFGLGGVPARRDVGVGGAADDDQRLPAVGVPPMVVVAREMTLQDGAFAVVEERQHRGFETVRPPRGDQIGRLVPRQQFVNRGVVGGEAGGHVHGSILPEEYARDVGSQRLDTEW